MKVTVEDIKKIPANGVLQVKLENNAACVSARNTVQYVKTCIREKMERLIRLALIGRRIQ